MPPTESLTEPPTELLTEPTTVPPTEPTAESPREPPAEPPTEPSSASWIELPQTLPPTKSSTETKIVIIDARSGLEGNSNIYSLVLNPFEATIFNL